MGRTVTKERIAAVVRLLGKGNTRNAVSKMLHMGSETVERIADGDTAVRMLGNWNRPVPSSGSASLPERCPSCGAMVLLPCLKCRLASRKGHGSVSQEELLETDDLPEDSPTDAKPGSLDKIEVMQGRAARNKSVFAKGDAIGEHAVQDVIGPRKDQKKQARKVG